MTTHIEKILAEVIEQMQIDGYECSGILADQKANEKIMDKDFPLFLFEIVNEKPLDTYETEIHLWFVICFPARSEKYQTVEIWETLRVLYLQFYNRLKGYVNQYGQYEIISLTDMTRKPFYDFLYLEIATSGFICEMKLKTIPLTSC